MDFYSPGCTVMTASIADQCLLYWLYCDDSQYCGPISAILAVLWRQPVLRTNACYTGCTVTTASIADQCLLYWLYCDDSQYCGPMSAISWTLCRVYSNIHKTPSLNNILRQLNPFTSFSPISSQFTACPFYYHALSTVGVTRYLDRCRNSVR